MVAIPKFKYGFLFVAWYRPGLVEWTLGVVCLSCGMQIQCLEINGTSGLPILGTYDHPVTAGLPVEGHWDWGVVGYWLGILVNHEAHWWYFH